MKLLFFSVTKHQYRYFETLKKSFNYTSKHLFFPSFSFSLKGFRYTKQLVLTDIFAIKFKEIDCKYTNPVTKFFYKLLLKLQTPWIVSSVYSQLKVFKPDYLIVWNGKKFHQAIAVEIAKNLHIQPVFFENGVLPNTTTMDFKGVNASNSVPRDISFFVHLQVKEDQQLPQTLQVRESKAKKKTFDTSLPERYIFIPFQVAYDTQIIQHSPWIKDMFELYDIIEWLSTQINIPFVIKEHPSDRVSDYTPLYTKANKNIIFSSQNTQELIENAACIITINSSVAMESLLFAKRVIVLGEAFFAINGIVKTAKSKEEIKTYLETMDMWLVDGKLIKRFLTYLYYDYLIPGDWRNPSQEHLDQIDIRLKKQYDALPHKFQQT
ncbi:hypothetical protein PGH07_03685 [Sulfurovum sp. zt1-1]|uniref:Capsular biosynthesis protein n=1 Tax=Sulfurovum zhangzhouensis TaxID=3019067 RepID=A0ABT7QXJ7_9BACT|nr:hypothetical protein [Sulfurovum zhangzhouensis]MDM5271269.1 hypothetical protein [Sulfurovum zhangzhouensis]